MNKKELKKIDKIIQLHLHRMQTEMQRFANEVMEMKFKQMEKELNKNVKKL